MFLDPCEVSAHNLVIIRGVISQTALGFFPTFTAKGAPKSFHIKRALLKERGKKIFVTKKKNSFELFPWGKIGKSSLKYWTKRLFSTKITPLKMWKQPYSTRECINEFKGNPISPQIEPIVKAPLITQSY